jgi:hypothetical protein
MILKVKFNLYRPVPAIQANHHYSVLSTKGYYVACNIW